MATTPTKHSEDSDQPTAQAHVREDSPVPVSSAPVPRRHPPSIIPCGEVSIHLDLPTPTSDHPSHPHLHRQPIRHLSAPAYQSPLRHHRRAPSRSKGVKETLDARSHYGSSDDDGGSVHRINQYNIKQEIGRGSFGAVHLAVDQYGNEFAVKEFSKSRLRKRAQSNLLRKPDHARRAGPGHLAAGLGFNSPLHRQSSSDRLNGESNNSLSLIKEEIAIMKKLDHPNLVSLIEVLDDPQEDSLYMVLEICKKGVVMKVGLEERAQPYGQDACRCWFRDMILGIEYLHAQGIIHRDIKPDNCLITHDDVLKIVDFGVSEMFQKESDMHTAKSAGSPAFMPPELCVVKHGAVSGRAADIWSMGVTLYCLRYGRIPFEQTNMLELYESIKAESVTLEDEQDQDFADLMYKLLEKDPEKRITMEELRIHPWVTRHGNDPLLPAEENCAALVEPPTEAEMNDAITGNMSHLMVVMKAVKRFKRLIRRKRPEILDSIFGRESRFSQPPHSVHSRGSRSVETQNRKPVESALAVEGVHRNFDDEISDPMLNTSLSEGKFAAIERKAGVSGASSSDDQSDSFEPSLRQKSGTFPLDERAKGQAHDPLEDQIFLHIGSNPDTTSEDHEYPCVSESPCGVDEDIYEAAYQEEMKRILESKGTADLVLTRRVEHIERLRRHPNVLASSINHAIDFAGVTGRRIQARATTGGFATFVREARETAREKAREKTDQASTPSSGEGRTPIAEDPVGGPMDGPTTPGSIQSGERAARLRDVARSQAGDVLKGVAKRLDEKATRLQARAHSGHSVLSTGASGASVTPSQHDV